MPVKTEPKERPIIRMLLSACEDGAWKDASLDWVEEKQDGAVEVIATRPDGATLALEHTLIQPFVGEKFDSEVFMKAFGRIEKNPSLVISERALDVIIPVRVPDPREISCPASRGIRTLPARKQAHSPHTIVAGMKI